MHRRLIGLTFGRERNGGKKFVHALHYRTFPKTLAGQRAERPRRCEQVRKPGDLENLDWLESKLRMILQEGRDLLAFAASGPQARSCLALSIQCSACNKEIPR
jgi:hypothetical protein